MVKELFKDLVDGKIKNPSTKNIVSVCQITLYLKKYHKEIYSEILKSNLSGSEYIYNIIHEDINKICYCKKPLKYINLHKGYRKYCSKDCQIKEMHKKFDVEGYPFKRPEVLEMMKQNNVTRYGVEYPFQSKEYQDMMTKKFNEKTGLNRTSQMYETKCKMAISHSLRYINSKGIHPGIVYMLEFKDYIKIGATENFDRRKHELKRDFGEFEILRLIDSDNIYEKEKEYHLRFSKFRRVLKEGTGRTEFFDKEILKEIDW